MTEKKTRKRDQKLTPRQRRFVVEYMEDLNATQAAIRSGYSKRTARGQGSRLKNMPHIERAIARRIERELKGSESKRSRLVHELNAIAFLDPREVVKWTKDSVTLVPSSKIPDHVAAAVKAVKETRDGIQVIFHDKLDAIDKLAKIHRAYKHIWDDERKTVVEGGDVHFTIEIGDRILRPGVSISEEKLKRGRDLEEIAKGPDLLLEPGEPEFEDDEGEW
jgi:phage terminase small subunit